MARSICLCKTKVSVGVVAMPRDGNRVLKCKTLGGIHMQALHHALTASAKDLLYQQAVECLAACVAVSRLFHAGCASS